VAKKRISCSELGISDCDYTASGEAAGDLVKEVVEHLRKEHDLDMPDADVIMAGEVKEDPLDLVDPAVVLVVERLIEALNIVPPMGPKSTTVPIGRTRSRLAR
jgi:predicted small metal-binding protein